MFYHRIDGIQNRSLAFESLEKRRMLAPVKVSTHADIVDWDFSAVNSGFIQDLINNPGNDGKISLREAVIATNFDPNPDNIFFAPGLAGETITLGKDDQGIRIQSLQGSAGQLEITDDLTVDAEGQGITINAEGTDPTPESTPDDGLDGDEGDGSRIFGIQNGFGVEINVIFSGLTLTGGDMGHDSDAIASGGGGAIAGDIGGSGTLQLHDMVFIDNYSGESGGAVYFEAFDLRDNNDLPIPGVLITDSVFRGNVAGRMLPGQNEFAGSGGAIYIGLGGALEVQRSVIVDNHALGNEILIGALDAKDGGGGIYSTNSVEIVDSLIEDNTTAGTGGGILVDARGDRITITNSTIAGNNAARAGGGIYAYPEQRTSQSPSQLEVTNTTISGNVVTAVGE